MIDVPSIWYDSDDNTVSGKCIKTELISCYKRKAIGNDFDTLTTGKGKEACRADTYKRHVWREALWLDDISQWRHEEWEAVIMFALVSVFEHTAHATAETVPRVKNEVVCGSNNNTYLAE